MNKLFPVGPFPWKLFLRFLAGQALLLTGVLLIARVPMWDLLVLTAGFVFFSGWMGRGLFMPLGRLIERARGGAEDWISGAELAEEEPGEWLDLEAALNHIRGDLRRKSQDLIQEREELAVLMASISDAILALDSSGRLLFYNSRFAILFGDRNMSANRVSLQDLFRNPEVLETFQRAIRQGQPTEVSLQLQTVDASLGRDFSLSFTPLRKEDGLIYGAVGVFHDVTELKRAERVRIDFVANVSHELRTPLTAIKGYTDTLVVDANAGNLTDVGKFLEVISRNADRLMALIEDLLDLSSLESGVELEKSLVSTREITQKVLSQLEPRRSAKDHQIETIYGVEQVNADSRRVEQVLVNLIDNAIKYVPRGQTIRVQWDPGVHAVLLRIIDHGPGIDPDSVARLFERFYRVDKARSRELGGTGLGLAIVKHIMQRHGGTASVKSELGRGSEFICDFPI